MKFEWDERKNALNKAKHGIGFGIAARVFADPHRIEKYDASHSDDEDRWLTIGMVYPAVLVVIYTERHNEVIRLISARQANEHEVRTYYDI